MAGIAPVALSPSCRRHIRGGILLCCATTVLSAQTAAGPPRPQSSTTVSVTADRTSVPAGETAKTVYTLDGKQLHDYPAVTLDESLGQHAGFQLFRRAPSRVANPTSEGISLRGLGSTAASRTLVLEDGAPLNDPFGGYIHWSEQPALDVGAATLVTGGGSDLYGSSALGGVIDVTPVSAAPARMVVSGAGGNQFTSDLQALASQTSRCADVLAAGQSLRTGGYIPTDPAVAGVVDVPANVRSQAYHAELGRRDARTRRLFLTGNLLNEARSNGTPLQTNATRLWRYLGGYSTPDGNPVAARGRLFGSQQGYRQSFSAIAANRNTEALTRLQRVHTQEIGGSADAAVHEGPLALVVGADARDLRATDLETPIVNGISKSLQDTSARQRFLGGFGEVIGQAGRWSGAASLRADRASNLSIRQSTAASAAPDRTEIVLSPRIGLTRSMRAGWMLHGSGFRAFRTPTMNELYRTGQVGQETTLANATLVSERATGFEAGTELSSHKRFAATATYFFTEINRPVSAVLVSRTATTITNQRQNLGQIRSQGVEATARYTWNGSLSAVVGYQYADALVTKLFGNPSLVGKRIPQVPAQSFTAQVRVANRHTGELTVALRAIGSSFDDSSNLYPLDRFFALDVFGRRSLAEHLDAFFLIQNLTDQRPQVSRTPTLTLGSPIFFQAGLRLSLSRAKP